MAHRNGYEPRAVKTASGVVQLQRPRIRNAEALGFESLVLGKGVTHALESLVVCSFLRGLSCVMSSRRSAATFDRRARALWVLHRLRRLGASVTGTGSGGLIDEYEPAAA